MFVLFYGILTRISSKINENSFSKIFLNATIISKISQPHQKKALLRLRNITHLVLSPILSWSGLSRSNKQLIWMNSQTAKKKNWEKFANLFSTLRRSLLSFTQYYQRTSDNNSRKKRMRALQTTADKSSDRTVCYLKNGYNAKLKFAILCDNSNNVLKGKILRP